jgi:hypothetical protein
MIAGADNPAVALSAGESAVAECLDRLLSGRPVLPHEKVCRPTWVAECCL